MTLFRFNEMHWVNHCSFIPSYASLLCTGFNLHKNAWYAYCRFMKSFFKVLLLMCTEVRNAQWGKPNHHGDKHLGVMFLSSPFLLSLSLWVFRDTVVATAPMQESQPHSCLAFRLTINKLICSHSTTPLYTVQQQAQYSPQPSLSLCVCFSLLQTSCVWVSLCTYFVWSSQDGWIPIF